MNGDEKDLQSFISYVKYKQLNILKNYPIIDTTLHLTTQYDRL